MVIFLHITAFDIEAGYEYDYDEDWDYDYDDYTYVSGCPDHLTIADGDGTILMGGWGNGLGGIRDGCGSVDVALPIDITTTSNTVKLVFKTDKGRLYKGWSLSWSAVTPGECQK